MKRTVVNKPGGIIKPGILEAGSVTVEKGSVDLWDEIEGLCGELRNKHEGKAWNDIPGVQETRELYRAMGIDPTKTRPSSEALLRRVMKGRELYRINNVVDVCNWCSLEFQLCIGLYDLNEISGEIIIREGEDGEGFPGIRKDDVKVAGRICVADDRGAFGSPTSDSARTMVTESTKRVVLILFCPADFDDDRITGKLETIGRRMAEHCSAGKTDILFPKPHGR